MCLRYALVWFSGIIRKVGPVPSVTWKYTHIENNLNS